MKSSNLYSSFTMKCFEDFAIKLDRPVAKDMSAICRLLAFSTTLKFSLHRNENNYGQLLLTNTNQAFRLVI